MTLEQVGILAILAGTVGMFLWGRWRHDLIAMTALVVSVATGLVPAGGAFSGLAQPAVVTVACVLILSAGLQTTGVVDALVQRILPQTGGRVMTVASLVGLGALLSAFMNNVGALALLLPAAVQIAGKHGLPPGRVLMPLSFGTILGGMTTLIGTPPNLIVSAFRAGERAGGFAMFDFAPVGVAVALVCIAFLVLVGWRLVPARQREPQDGLSPGSYITEARVSTGSKAAGRTLHDVEQQLEESDAQVVGMVRDGFRVAIPSRRQRIRIGDILVIEADPRSLATVLSGLGLVLEENVPLASRPTTEEEGPSPPQGGGDEAEDAARGERPPEDVELQELVVMPGSAVLGRSARDLRLRTRHGLNLLAISHQGERPAIRRLRSTPLRTGDVLLVQGGPETITEFAANHGCLPLAKRSIRLPDRKKTLVAAGAMVLAIGGAAFGLMPAAIAFAAAVLIFALFRVVPARSIYDAVDWPVIILLAALIPVAGAMHTTGAADAIARSLLAAVAPGRPTLALLVILVVTMTLSDFMNNAATAAVMCPIALSTATQFGTSADPFLMAVAAGSSCAFLTPIGHQNNTLILGPGGFRFGDYWRLGIVIEILVVAVGLPVILLVWPF